MRESSFRSKKSGEQSRRKDSLSVEDSKQKTRDLPQSQSPEIRRVSSNQQLSANDKFEEYTSLAFKTQTVMKGATAKQVSRNIKNFSDFGTHMKTSTFNASKTSKVIGELRGTHEQLSQRNFKSALTTKSNNVALTS